MTRWHKSRSRAAIRAASSSCCPTSNGQTVQLNGAPYSPLTNGLVTSGFGFTEVDQTFWETWSGNFASSALLSSGAVWEV